MTNKELLSQTISWLRFPLMVGVVLIHNNMTTINIQGQEIDYSGITWYADTIYLFREVISRISVPLFFFISGFLFFYNTEFNIGKYWEKLKKRIHTLLIPYIVWNFVGFLILLIKVHPLMAKTFPSLADYHIGIDTFFASFWSISLSADETIRGTYFPINSPLWFIRDLIIAAVLSPIIYQAIKKYGSITLSIAGILWMTNGFGYLEEPQTNCLNTLFFFPLGAYFSIHHIDFIAVIRKIKPILIAYPILAIIDMAYRNDSAFHLYAHNLCILTGIAVAISIAAWLIESGKTRPDRFLTNGSFFIYVLHILFIQYITKAIIMALHPQSPYLLIAVFFAVPVITIAICLMIYHVMSRTMPTITKIISGGR